MNTDYLEKYEEILDVESIQELRAERQLWLKRKSNQKYEEALRLLAPFPTKHVILGNKKVSIGAAEELSPTQHDDLNHILKTFIPWRKGPFEIFGNAIDSEWKSDLKWDRVFPQLDSLEGKKIADIGCNNGYYMFRMAAHNPELVIGLDPTVRHWYAFTFLQQFTQIQSLHFELLGIEHMHHYYSFFDVVFCMGVLYHHPNPIGMLRGILKSMKIGGQLIVESLGIPGDESIALFPEKRYAKVPGNWFVPTQTCLMNWIKRSGFKEVTPFYGHQLLQEEQRSTEWAPYQSLEDFLDPTDSTKTIEGYPAPHRFYISARKLND